ncbi:hypothetical protein FA13DRAFT_342090 [Coprinellus micaceus]|uniref:Zn(2)-C6 fungal-type domain-containing protein n=1 Tax=Coprinellus micaceus TaxID=71717 RepID=A0A4Y7TCU1_COPMI|nr:hypothetical protein FA13DRAFT_342090 [Coprinellus micaceus]
MTSRDDAPDPALVHTILSPITALLHPSSVSDTEELLSKPPSPTLSMHSIHFQTSTALGDLPPIRAGGAPNASGQGEIHPRKALRRGEACLNCRRRKIKCDGVKPVCMPCRRDGCNEDACCGKSYVGPDTRSVNGVNGSARSISENGVTYNITHNYGTVNNVGTIKKAEFHDDTGLIRSSTYAQPAADIRIPKWEPPERICDF